MFVPVSLGPAQSDWSYVRQALKYSAWHDAQVRQLALWLVAGSRQCNGDDACWGGCGGPHCQALWGLPSRAVLSQLNTQPRPAPQTSGTPQGNSNAFVSDAWTLRAPRMIYANSRGPGCFDFGFYVQARGAALCLPLNFACRQGVQPCALESRHVSPPGATPGWHARCAVRCARFPRDSRHPPTPLPTVPPPHLPCPPLQHNPDMQSKASMHQLLWEHYVLVGQFQGRPHRWEGCQQPDCRQSVLVAPSWCALLDRQPRLPCCC